MRNQKWKLGWTQTNRIPQVGKKLNLLAQAKIITWTQSPPLVVSEHLYVKDVAQMTQQ